MIIVNEKKLIRNSEEKKLLDYIKHKSNNNCNVQCIFRSNSSFYNDCDVLILYCFKIDDITYTHTINTHKTSHNPTINKIQNFKNFVKESAEKRNNIIKK